MFVEHFIPHFQLKLRVKPIFQWNALYAVYCLKTISHMLQVILVGHDFGGACISYAMEAFPLKIAKAVFVSAAMLQNSQNTLDMFSQQVFHSSLS